MIIYKFGDVFWEIFQKVSKILIKLLNIKVNFTEFFRNTYYNFHNNKLYYIYRILSKYTIYQQNYCFAKILSYGVMVLKNNLSCAITVLFFIQNGGISRTIKMFPSRNGEDTPPNHITVYIK